MKKRMQNMKDPQMLSGHGAGQVVCNSKHYPANQNIFFDIGTFVGYSAICPLQGCAELMANCIQLSSCKEMRTFPVKKL
jgi:hypothetical protein